VIACEEVPPPFPLFLFAFTSEEEEEEEEDEEEEDEEEEDEEEEEGNTGEDRTGIGFIEVLDDIDDIIPCVDPVIIDE
jgi:hypothetical protein